MLGPPSSWMACVIEECRVSPGVPLPAGPVNELPLDSKLTADLSTEPDLTWNGRRASTGTEEDCLRRKPTLRLLRSVSLSPAPLAWASDPPRRPPAVVVVVNPDGNKST